MNARISESPKFLGIIILPLTAFAYAISGLPASNSKPLITVSTLLSFLTILWGKSYIASLGYSFRYLQYTQYRIADDLGWSKYKPRFSDHPPLVIKRWCDVFWLLPGIYPTILSGLVLLEILMGAAFVYNMSIIGLNWVNVLMIIQFPIVFSIGYTWLMNFYYLSKMTKWYKSKHPKYRQRADKLNKDNDEDDGHRLISILDCFLSISFLYCSSIT